MRPDPFAGHRALFEGKPLLRRVYREDFFARIRAHCRPGPTVEIGAGPGLLKKGWPGIFATDIAPARDIDAVLDACRLPCKTNSLANVVGLDVLHHLPEPMSFLTEVERALRPGGRMVLIEPWLTAFSRFIYRHFHHEDCDESADPAAPFHSVSGAGKDPMEGNQALPFLLFGPGRARTSAQIPSLRVEKLDLFSGAAYLLSLGFKPGSLAPGWSFPLLHAAEEWTGPFWKPWGALRALIVLLKAGS